MHAPLICVGGGFGFERAVHDPEAGAGVYEAVEEEGE